MSDYAQTMLANLASAGIGSGIVITFATDRSLDNVLFWADDHAEVTRMDRIADRIRTRELDVQTCRYCGCTDSDACRLDGKSCAWAEDNLCTFCAQQLEKLIS